MYYYLSIAKYLYIGLESKCEWMCEKNESCSPEIMSKKIQMSVEEVSNGWQSYKYKLSFKE